MSARSLNKVMLIGNLTRDPECRYTPNQTLVCSFGLATNREWATDGGEKQSSVEYHNLVVWSKLAEICKNLLHKGNKIYTEGRLQTRDWQTKDGQSRRTTEIIVESMILLTSRGASQGGGEYNAGDPGPVMNEPAAVVEEKAAPVSEKVAAETAPSETEVMDESDMPC
jgi:single-strand DNA-binding protein